MQLLIRSFILVLSGEPRFHSHDQDVSPYYSLDFYRFANNDPHSNRVVSGKRFTFCRFQLITDARGIRIRKNGSPVRLSTKSGPASRSHIVCLHQSYTNQTYRIENYYFPRRSRAIPRRSLSQARDVRIARCVRRGYRP